jgi:hypothetical protein
MDPGDQIYTIDEFRCWKVENLDENKNEAEGGANANGLHIKPTGIHLKGV